MSQNASSTFIVSTEQGWAEVIDVLVKSLSESQPQEILLEGDLGAGKTFLVGELLKRLGSAEVARSPSYVLEHRYEAPRSRYPISHWDIYRLRGALPDELQEPTAEYSRIIEWGTLNVDLVARATMIISITITSLISREVSITKKLPLASA